jgi:LysM repeat protein
MTAACCVIAGVIPIWTVIAAPELERLGALALAKPQVPIVASAGPVSAERAVLVARGEPVTALRKDPPGLRVHAVTSGETLLSIAARYGITPQTLAYNNGIKDTAQVRAGQSLVIPPIDAAIHVVREGETLAGIAASFGADADTVRAVNSVAFEPADVVAGRVLLIPMPEGRYPGFRLVVSDAPRVFAPRIRWPTDGIVTQLFSQVHTGIDIAAPYRSGGRRERLGDRHGDRVAWARRSVGVRTARLGPRGLRLPPFGDERRARGARRCRPAHRFGRIERRFDRTARALGSAHERRARRSDDLCADGADGAKGRRRDGLAVVVQCAIASDKRCQVNAPSTVRAKKVALPEPSYAWTIASATFASTGASTSTLHVPVSPFDRRHVRPPSAVTRTPPAPAPAPVSIRIQPDVELVNCGAPKNPAADASGGVGPHQGISGRWRVVQVAPPSAVA